MFRCFPAVLIIGVMKGGTSELLAQARAHPHLHAPSGEEHWFGQHEGSHAPRAPSSWHHYLWSKRNKAWGSLDIRSGAGLAIEKTPSYFRYDASLAHIRLLLPSARLVLLLREPADRAYSHFRMTAPGHSIAMEQEPQVFQQKVSAALAKRCASVRLASLATCLERLGACTTGTTTCSSVKAALYEDRHTPLSTNDSLIERSLYSDRIRAMYRTGWGCDHVTIIVTEQFLAQPTAELRSLWRALGLPYNTTIADDHRGAAPHHHTSLPMLNTTRLTLTKFFDPDVRDTVALLPALNLKMWWPAYF